MLEIEKLEKMLHNSDVIDKYPFFYFCTSEDMKVKFRSQFFYPNTCYVCNDDHVSSLIRCSHCNMIAYCGKLHRMEHWSQHKDLCGEIVNLLKSSASNNLFGFLRTMENPEKRLKKKQNLIAAIQKRLNRKFDKFEKEMFHHPRVCVVCLESNAQKLDYCRFCHQVSFCENHKNAEHECSYYRLCFLLDWKSVIDTRFVISPAIENVPFFCNPEDSKLPENMAKFLTEKAEETIPMLTTLNGDKLWPHVCSELYTNSLTLMRMLQDLEFEFESELIVHAIGNHSPGEKDFENFEMLLHLIPQLRTLKIIVIGKIIDQNNKETKPEVAVCKTCNMKSKTLIIERTKLTYVSYVESKAFSTPHVVIAYNFEESEVRLWTESVKKFMDIRAPFIMTTCTKSRAQREHKKMSELFGHLASKSSFLKNPFAGDRPYRDPQEDGLKFSNNYVAVYTLFEEEREKQTKKKKRRGQSEVVLPDFIIAEEREVRRQKSLAKKKETAQVYSETTDESEKMINYYTLSNSGENIEKSTGGSPNKKVIGEGKSKTKKKKTASQYSESSRKNSLFYKAEKSMDIKKEDVPKTLHYLKEELNSPRDATAISKELLNEQNVDSHSQNQDTITIPKENEENAQGDLINKESGAEVFSSAGETEEVSRKSSNTEELLLDSTNRNNVSELGADQTPVEATKSDKPIQDPGELRPVEQLSSVENKSEAEIPVVDEQREDDKNSKSVKQPLDLANRSKEAKSDERGEEAYNKTKSEKVKYEIHESAAEVNVTSNSKDQEQKEKSTKSKKRQEFLESRVRKEPFDNRDEPLNLAMIQGSSSSKPSRGSENPKDQPAGTEKLETAKHAADVKETDQAQKEVSTKSKKNKNSKNQESKTKKEAVDNRGKPLNLQIVQGSSSSKNTEKLETPKHAADENESSENTDQAQKEGSTKSKNINKEFTNQEFAEFSIRKKPVENRDQPLNLQIIHDSSSSEPNEVSEKNEKPKDPPADTEKLETHKHAADEKESSENTYQAQKERSTKSKKKNKKSKNQESAESRIRKEPVENRAEPLYLQTIHGLSSSEPNGVSENNEKLKDQPAVAKKSENKVQEQNGESIKSEEKKNKIRNEISTDTGIKKEEPVLNQDGVKGIMKRTENLRQENAYLEAQIVTLTAQFTGLKNNCNTMALSLLNEITVLKQVLQSLEDKVKGTVNVHELE